jgi:hypothetical protein
MSNEISNEPPAEKKTSVNTYLSRLNQIVMFGLIAVTAFVFTTTLAALWLAFEVAQQGGGPAPPLTFTEIRLPESAGVCPGNKLEYGFTLEAKRGGVIGRVRTVYSLSDGVTVIPAGDGDVRYFVWQGDEQISSQIFWTVPPLPPGPYVLATAVWAVDTGSTAATYEIPFYIPPHCGASYNNAFGPLETTGAGIN